jgi:hypothetical protein
LDDATYTTTVPEPGSLSLLLSAAALVVFCFPPSVFVRTYSRSLCTKRSK